MTFFRISCFNRGFPRHTRLRGILKPPFRHQQDDIEEAAGYEIRMGLRKQLSYRKTEFWA